MGRRLPFSSSPKCSAKQLPVGEREGVDPASNVYNGGGGGAARQNCKSQAVGEGLVGASVAESALLAVLGNGKRGMKNRCSKTAARSEANEGPFVELSKDTKRNQVRWRVIRSEVLGGLSSASITCCRSAQPNPALFI